MVKIVIGMTIYKGLKLKSFKVLSYKRWVIITIDTYFIQREGKMKTLLMVLFAGIFCCLAMPVGSFGDVTEKATHEAYIDGVTGHRYVKMDDVAYKEFNKKGEFFRIVPADQPHLTNRRYVRPLAEDCYLLYSKVEGKDSKSMVLKAEKAHPKGWTLEKALVSLK